MRAGFLGKDADRAEGNRPEPAVVGLGRVRVSSAIPLVPGVVTQIGRRRPRQSTALVVDPS